MLPSIWISNLLTVIACLLPILFQLSILSLIAVELLFILGENFSYPYLSLLTFDCIGPQHFLSQVTTNESYRQLGSFLLSLIVYLSFVTSTSSLDAAGFVCLVMRLLNTIVTMFIPIEENTYWESLRQPSISKLEHSHRPRGYPSHTISTREAISFFFTVFCLFLFNSLFTFTLIQSIFTSSRSADISATYWILSLLITQATMIGTTLLTSVLISVIGKRNTYVLASVLISLRGGLLYLLLRYSAPLTHILFTHLLEGYSSGLLSVLVIIDSETLSRSQLLSCSSLPLTVLSDPLITSHFSWESSEPSVSPRLLLRTSSPSLLFLTPLSPLDKLSLQSPSCRFLVPSPLCPWIISPAPPPQPPFPPPLHRAPRT
jgi:hypothetical protein